jgi:23S rRNA (uracil1939-C5)-methyltransferase
MSLERVRVEKIVSGALGLARIDGQVVLLAGALPGELVEARVSARKGRLEGVVENVIEPSSGRVDLPRGAPPTMDFGFADYATQLTCKQSIVQDSLERIGKLEFEVMPTQASPLEWRYRNTAQYMVTPLGLAYRERASHDAKVIRDDPLVCEFIASGVQDLDMRLLEPASEIAFRASLETGEVLVALVGIGKSREYYSAREHLRDLGVTGVSFAFASTAGRFRDGVQHLWGEENILERYGDFDLSVTATSFAQVNPKAAGKLYQRVAELAAPGSSVLDLYGGAGGMALHLTKKFESVTVLEINPESIDRGRSDAGRLGVLNLNFVQGDASRLEKYPSDVITVDPPRAGLSTDALNALLRAQASQVIYVSCDPGTWARDAGKLVRAGYNLKHAEPWDFYPHTSHVEVLSVFEL